MNSFGPVKYSFEAVEKPEPEVAMRAIVKKAIILALPGIMFSPSGALAATYIRDAVVDLGSYVEGAVQPYFDTKAVEFTPVSLAVGDTLTGTMTFKDDVRLTILNNPAGSEAAYMFLASPGFPQVNSNATIELLGLEGQLSGANPNTAGNGGCCIAAGRGGELTSGQFSFTGISYTLTITKGVLPNFDAYEFQASRGFYSATAAVPESATWAMTMLGLMSVGALLRVRRQDALLTPAFL